MKVKQDRQLFIDSDLRSKINSFMAYEFGVTRHDWPHKSVDPAEAHLLSPNLILAASYLFAIATHLTRPSSYEFDIHRLIRFYVFDLEFRSEANDMIQQAASVEAAYRSS